GRVDRLLLVCPAAGGVEPGPAVRAFGQAEDALLEAGDVDGATALNVRTWLGPDADDTTRATLTTWQRATFDAQLPLGEDVGSPRPDVDLAGLDVPTVVVVGAHDPLASVGEHVARTVPGAVLHRLAWAGHLPTLERPSEAAALVRRLLDSP
ncbi:MAG: alpha/beta hydrolase, partial [Actinomycetota bacterium]